MFELRRGTPTRSPVRAAPPESERAATRAAEVLIHAGGALPIERLSAGVPAEAPGAAAPLARAVRQRGDLFLLVERPAIPWEDAGETWSATDRAEYDRARRRDETVVLLDGVTGAASVRAPALLRESLLSMWGESPEDAHVRRELGRLPDLPNSGDAE